jgi:hypothetical protein
VSKAKEGRQEEDIGAVIAWPHICLAVEGSGLVGLYASCNHKVGKEAGVVGAHGVGEKVNVEGGGQHICVAEVTCVVWRWVVALSNSRSSARRFSN